jgi:uncharacterized protein (TIGR02001 family)
VNRLALPFTAALALASAPASADPARPPKYGPCDGAFAQVSGVTDYRFDGFSESNRHPTWQATGYCYWSNGAFVGATFTGVDFLDEPRTHFEADWYVGRQIQLGRGYSALIDVFYATFPDKRAPGPSYNLVEPQVELDRTHGRLTLKGQVGWTPNDSGAGPAWHFKGQAAYRLTPWLTLSGEAGRYERRRAADYDHWDIGATASRRRLSLDVRWGGTDRPPQECFFTDWCKPGAYATVSYRLLP